MLKVELAAYKALSQEPFWVAPAALSALGSSGRRGVHRRGRDSSLGAGIGTVVGNMAGRSISRGRAKSEQNRLSDHDVVVVVRDGVRVQEANAVLRSHGAYLVEHARDESAIAAASPSAVVP
jgi:rhodanese-related sulfurtransferase